jgi:CubicO group peptidase (beta-lactamase class C family)
VCPDTAFDIGSCSKAYVATAIALLASNGRLRLDDPVRAYLPDFELDEDVVTESITIRDLLCNRTGLRRQIPVTAYSNPEIPAQEILHRVRYMDRVHAFRQGYVYFNPGFMACAQVVENVTGMPYSAFLEKELFAAIGLRHTASGPRVSDTLPGRASGHTFVQGQSVPLTGPVYHNLEGAAAVYSSAADAIRWMKFHLDGGRAGQSPLIKPEILVQTHAPHTQIPDAECKLIHRPPEAERCDYCMGWWLTELNDHPLLQHAGEAVGWRAMVAMLPEQKIGVSVFLDAAKGVHQAISYTILETLLKGSSRDWVALAIADRVSTASQIEQHAASAFPCTLDAPASVPLEKLAGRYRHGACSEVQVTVIKKGLEMRFIDGRLWDTRLTHIGNEVFECRLLRSEARDFMFGSWRGRFEIKDGKVLWLEDINARYERISSS